MTESVVLTLIAGIAGIMLGVGVLRVVGIMLQNTDAFFKDPQVSFTVAIGALFILVIIGLFAGYLPARRAMQIKAIEAIRDEN